MLLVLALLSSLCFGRPLDVIPRTGGGVFLSGRLNESEWVILALKKDGSEERNFAHNGKLVLNVGNYRENVLDVMAVPSRENGLFVITFSRESANSNYSVLLARKYDEFGRQLTWYGTHGLAEISHIRGGLPALGDVRADRRGNLFILSNTYEGATHQEADYSITKFTPEGEPDLGFGVAGRADIPYILNGTNQILFPSDNGQVYLAVKDEDSYGGANTKFMLAEFHETGELKTYLKLPVHFFWSNRAEEGRAAERQASFLLDPSRSALVFAVETDSGGIQIIRYPTDLSAPLINRFEGFVMPEMEFFKDHSLTYSAENDSIFVLGKPRAGSTSLKLVELKNQKVFSTQVYNDVFHLPPRDHICARISGALFE